MIYSEGSCYNCQERKQGCHSTCEKYSRFKQRLATIKENREEYKKRFAYTAKHQKRR